MRVHMDSNTHTRTDIERDIPRNININISPQTISFVRFAVCVCVGLPLLLILRSRIEVCVVRICEYMCVRSSIYTYAACTGMYITCGQYDDTRGGRGPRPRRRRRRR